MPVVVSSGGVPTQYPAVTLVNADGSLYDPANTPTVVSVVDSLGEKTTGECVPPRMFVTKGDLAMYSGYTIWSYFTARTTETITQVRTWNGSTAAAATPTLCRIGIYSVATNGDITLVAAIANDTALWGTASTEYTRALTTSFDKVAGNRYAVGEIIVTAGATPHRRGWLGAGAGSGAARALFSRAPKMCGLSVGGLTDLPASVASASIADWESMIAVELLP